ncbi:VOC family protein [Paenarthrobacter sp. Z7-10]|uniref:VOC family protein n=1 Tax=Paenarthrobacter sp. Z7-10 TaxID=2787635 RepID=UPI0022A8E2B4|nr:VOC family protein [Paenarthrobacter sp. Z7-10]MCZ2403021.1 VOC family protein [Paenarthrobacter sp. Z7-10]
MEWKLEVIPVPVADVDASKKFYAEAVGFTVDHDVRPRPDMRVVQLTPAGSACSIVLGVSGSAPGSLKGLQLVVEDINAARQELVLRGVAVSEVTHLGEGNGSAFLFFDDPDGNSWSVQELRRAEATHGTEAKA